MRLVLLGAVHRDPSGKKRLRRALETIGPAAVSLEVSPASVSLRQDLNPRWTALFKRRLKRESRRSGLTPGELMRSGGLRGVFEYLRLPYEYRAAAEYARDRAVPLFLLDDSRVAEAFLGQVESELLTEDNIRKLAQNFGGNGLIREVTEHYTRAAALFSRDFEDPAPPETLSKNIEAWTEREEGLAQRLRLLHQGLARRAGRDLSGDDLAAGLIVAPEAIGHMPESIRLEASGAHVYVGGWQHLVVDRTRSTLFSRLEDLHPERGLCLDFG